MAGLAYKVPNGWLKKVKAMNDADRTLGIVHKLEAVPLDRIRERKPWSKAKLDEALRAIHSGREIDPVRLSREDDGTYSIDDGIHRTAAARTLGYSKIAALTSGFARKRNTKGRRR